MLSDRTYNVQATIDEMDKIKDLDMLNNKAMKNLRVTKVRGALAKSQNWSSVLDKGRRLQMVQPERGNGPAAGVRGSIQSPKQLKAGNVHMASLT